MNYLEESVGVCGGRGGDRGGGEDLNFFTRSCSTLSAKVEEKLVILERAQLFPNMSLT